MAVSRFKESADLDKILADLPIELRNKGLKKAVRKAATIQRNEARRRAPRETPNINRPEAKQLYKTIQVTTREYKNGQVIMAISGPTSKEGPHGHLIEHGHDVVVSRGERKGSAPLSGTARVEGKEWFAPSIDVTEPQVDKKVIEIIAEEIQKNGG